MGVYMHCSIPSSIHVHPLHSRQHLQPRPTHTTTERYNVHVHVMHLWSAAYIFHTCKYCACTCVYTCTHIYVYTVHVHVCLCQLQAQQPLLQETATHRKVQDMHTALAAIRSSTAVLEENLGTYTQCHVLCEHIEHNVSSIESMYS